MGYEDEPHPWRTGKNIHGKDMPLSAWYNNQKKNNNDSQQTGPTYHNGENSEDFIDKGCSCIVSAFCISAIVCGVLAVADAVYQVSKKKDKDFIEQYFPYILEVMEDDVTPSEAQKDSINNNKTSSFHFNGNKTLILFPDHALDQENVLNPQWRFQCG